MVVAAVISMKQVVSSANIGPGLRSSSNEPLLRGSCPRRVGLRWKETAATAALASSEQSTGAQGAPATKGREETQPKEPSGSRERKRSGNGLLLLDYCCELS
ncbi:hypothetical protein MRX96_014910 [Rhipicephalus microplus]